ncbi:MAG TPA: hypothetical protein VH500_02195 [Nitrososphaeraceae archaeon]
MVLFGYQFKLVLEPIYGQAMNTSAATNDHVPNAQDQVLTPSHSVAKQTLLSVKIASLSKGQQVPVGELEVFGISSDSQTTQCDVSVMLNGIKPYQHVIPIGHGGSSDFSEWKYSFTPQYGIIIKGMNKITSKISCPNESGTDLTKFNSVSVIGVIGTSNSSHSLSHQTLNLESTTTVENRITISTQPTATDTAGSNVSQNSQKSKIENSNPNSKTISLSFNIDRDPVIRGHVQTIPVALYDSNTNARIVGAKVTGQIIDSFNSVKKEFAGMTNTKGELSYSWKIPKTGKLNDEYKVKVDAVASGYPRELYTTIFKVRGGHNPDTPFILAQANSKFNDGLVDSINDFTQKMLDNIEQKVNATSSR